MKEWSFMYCSTIYKFNAWYIWQSPPASLIFAVSYLVP